MHQVSETTSQEAAAALAQHSKEADALSTSRERDRGLGLMVRGCFRFIGYRFYRVQAFALLMLSSVGTSMEAI